MSKLLKVLYDVAEIRCRYHRVQEQVFGFSARRLLRTMSRTSSESPAPEPELDELLSRLLAAEQDLESLNEQDVAIRRGQEVRSALLDYVRALAETIASLKALCEYQKSTDNTRGELEPDRLTALKVTYDDSVQYHKRLGARLNQLISTL